MQLYVRVHGSLICIYTKTTLGINPVLFTDSPAIQTSHSCRHFSLLTLSGHFQSSKWQ